MSKKDCELCNKPARMFCESDQASLCFGCDEKVHAANFLVAKHSRTLLCHVCRSPTPWRAHGPKLGPTLSVCHACTDNGCRPRGGGSNKNNNNNDAAAADVTSSCSNSSTQDQHSEDEEDEQECDDDSYSEESDDEFDDDDDSVCDDSDGYSEEEEEEEEEEDDDDDEDGENQVVPLDDTWQQRGGESSSRDLEIIDNKEKYGRSSYDTFESDDEDDDGCCSSQHNIVEGAKLSDDASYDSFAASRPSKRIRRSLITNGEEETTLNTTAAIIEKLQSF